MTRALPGRNGAAAVYLCLRLRRTGAGASVTVPADLLDVYHDWQPGDTLVIERRLNAAFVTARWSPGAEEFAYVKLREGNSGAALTIPASMRRALRWEIGDLLAIVVVMDGIMVVAMTEEEIDRHWKLANSTRKAERWFAEERGKKKGANRL